jgi:hypothetical protein
MNKITLSLAAAAFVGLGTVGASAMPAGNLSIVNVGLQADQVRMVCNQWGRCWNVGHYRSYVERRGWREHRGEWREEGRY